MTVKDAASAQQVGKLYFSRSGWLVLSVPNAMVRGHFDSLAEPGIELPVSGTTGQLNAHISVMRPDELQSIGGARAVTERGRDFHYILGKMKDVNPDGWDEMSKAWLIPVKSLELEQLRKTYGLPKQPKYPFHITVAVRRKGVLYANEKGKGDTAHVRVEGRNGAGGRGDRQENFGNGQRIAVQYTGSPESGKRFLDGIGVKEGSGAAAGEKAAATAARGVRDSRDTDPHEGDNLWFDLLDDLLPLEKSAVALPGIPDIKDLGDLSKVQAGQMLDFVIQKHKAQRAGEHYDVRFGSPDLGAYSWATKKELPDASNKISLFQQPLHHHGYMPFQGTLHGGYGAGTVRTHQKGKIEVTKAAPDKISFTLAGDDPKSFALVRTKDKRWLLINTTQPAGMAKAAFVKLGKTFRFEGDVLGVGLRKTLHKMMDEEGLTGAAYNDARNQQVMATLGGDDKKINKVLASLEQYLQAHPKASGKFGYTAMDDEEPLMEYSMTPEDLAAGYKRQGFAILGKSPIEEQRAWAKKRFRLQDEGDNLRGVLPQHAIRQLQGHEPVYWSQLTQPEEYGPTGFAKVADDIFGPWFEKEGLSLPQTIANEARKVQDPTDAQAQAGNYRKGHFKMHGMDFTIENARGSVRSGTGPDGKKWSSTMRNHYGYIRRTEDKDGDHVDVFLGGSPNTELVFVVDQRDPATGRFDEHKTMWGFETKEEARQAYLANYEKGWKGLGEITALTLDQFKAWLEEGSQMRPVASQIFQIKKADEDPDGPPILIIQRRMSMRFIAPEQERKLPPELYKQLQLHAARIGQCADEDPDKILEELKQRTCVP